MKPVKVLRAQVLYMPLDITLAVTKERLEMSLTKAAARRMS